MDKLKALKVARCAVKDSLDWNDLPSGPSYMESDLFGISVAHSNVTLVRTGQQCCGGKNYWDSPIAINNALMSYIVKNWNLIYPELEKVLISDADAAILDCQEFINDMQGQIDAVKDNDKG